MQSLPQYPNVDKDALFDKVCYAFEARAKRESSPVSPDDFLQEMYAALFNQGLTALTADSDRLVDQDADTITEWAAQRAHEEINKRHKERQQPATFITINADTCMVIGG